MGTKIPELPMDRPSTMDLSAIAIAPLWRRFAAFLVDTVLLGIVGSIIGMAFSNGLVRMGLGARLLGFSIALCYFAFFDSAPGYGRSPGKRLFRLKVVNVQGEMLSLEDAILRFAVIGIPYFANHLAIPISRTPWFVTLLVNLIVFCGGAVNLYLLLFNRSTRQGLHDWISRSYVLMSNSEAPAQRHPLPRIHKISVTVLLMLLGSSSFLFSPLVLKRVDIYSRMLEYVSLVEKIEGVQSAEALEVSRFHLGASGSSKTLKINVRWAGEPDNDVEVARQVEQAVIQADHFDPSYNALNVSVTRGYDMGISSGWKSSVFSYSSEDWRPEK